jgi:hypothetical protein
MLVLVLAGRSGARADVIRDPRALVGTDEAPMAKGSDAAQGGNETPMQATYVQPHQTPLTLDEAAQKMSAALAAALGAAPATDVLALALGKTALETGRWSAIWNGNWGNVKCSDSYSGLFTAITLNEVIDGKVVWFSPYGRLTGNPSRGGRLAGDLADAGRQVPPGHPQTRLRAFSTSADGALDYVRFVAGGRYAAAWQRLLAGDAAGYVHALKKAGYFTADESTYAKGVVALQKEFVAKLSGLPHNEPTVEVPHPDDVRTWLAPQDIAALEAELAERYFDTLDETRTEGLAEMSGNDTLAEGEPNV